MKVLQVDGGDSAYDGCHELVKAPRRNLRHAKFPSDAWKVVVDAVVLQPSGINPGRLEEEEVLSRAVHAGDLAHPPCEGLEASLKRHLDSDRRPLNLTLVGAASSCLKASKELHPGGPILLSITLPPVTYSRIRSNDCLRRRRAAFSAI